MPDRRHTVLEIVLFVMAVWLFLVAVPYVAIRVSMAPTPTPNEAPAR